MRTNLRAQSAFDTGKPWQLRGPLYRSYEKIALKIPDLVVVHSRPDFTRIAALARNALLADAMFNDSIYSGNHRDSTRSGVIWVGRFEWQKDPLLAIRAFAASAEGHDETMTMIGDGMLRPEAERLIKELNLENRVRIEPVQSQEELAGTLRAAKALLHTSFFEGAPRTLVEASAEGVLLVTCQESDPEQLAIGLGLGVQAEERSEKGFADALSKALRLETPGPVEALEKRAGSRYVPWQERAILAHLARGNN